MSLASIIAVNALIIYGDSILLVQENKEAVRGKRNLPGGKMEIGESFDQTLIREVEEETGIKPDQYDFKKLTILHNYPSAAVKHLYEIQLKHDVQDFCFDPTEIQQVKWFPLDEIPSLEEYRRPRVYEVIQDYKNGLFADGAKVYTVSEYHEQ